MLSRRGFFGCFLQQTPSRLESTIEAALASPLVTRRTALKIGGAGALAAVAGCVYVPAPSEGRLPKKSLYDIVKDAVAAFDAPEQIRSTAVDETVRELESYVKTETHPIVTYLLAMAYAANGTLTNGKLKASGDTFETLIGKFEADSMTLERVRELVTNELYALPAYQEGKSRLLASIAFAPKSLYPIYAFMCMLEGNYVHAAWAAEACVTYYGFDRRKKIAGRIDECVSRARERDPEDLYEISGLESVRDALIKDNPGCLSSAQPKRE